MKNLKNNLSEKDTLINKNLGDWLRKERKKGYIVVDGKKKPITQSMVAEKLGVTFQQVQKYEKGDNTIPIFRWFALCDYFSVQPSTVKELVTSQEVINITENKTGDNNDNNDVCPKE
tara:strand:- start:982 stop:1332 length:351 start_codon:yes stop_codon:yes gene_type:complete